MKRPGRIGPKLTDGEKYAIIEYLKSATYENYPTVKVEHQRKLPCADDSDWAKRQALRSPVVFKGPVEYDCTRVGGGNDTVKATFYQTAPAMVLLEHNQDVRPAFQVISADGSKYEEQDLMFWEARGEATVKCKPR